MLRFGIGAYLGCAMWMIVVLSADAQTAQAVSEDSAYTKAINQRADKIVKTLSIESHERALRVRNIIADQYRSLSKIHDARNARIDAIKSTTLDKQSSSGQIESIEKNSDIELDSLHRSYLQKLASELTTDQIEKVKDGMTYNVLPITYKGYQDMIPELTEDQKQKILNYLVEAREHAMDAGSSEKKHWWFGKYKGRINNYLSSEGYDLKKAGEEWEARRKASGRKS